MASVRGEFSSRFGFIMAAAGSAVGLGNIWGFPTQAASNGGAAFLFVYLVLAFVLAYPALMAEIILGRHAHANAVKALSGVSDNPMTALIGRLGGLFGMIVASFILSFYAIVAGWMVAYFLSSLVGLAGLGDAAAWLTGFGLTRNVIFML
ncbi:MAG: sodium-dependent transporter, partial [Pseudomonadota bacterium]